MRWLAAVVAFGLLVAPLGAQQPSVVVPTEVRVNVPFRVVATQDVRSGVLGYRLFVDDVQNGPDAPPSALVHGAVTLSGLVTTAGNKVVRVVAFDAQGEISGPPIVIKALNAGCEYQAPSGGPVTIRPARTRILGMNLIETQAQRDEQAARLKQLESWGWEVSADTLDAGRVLMVALCP